MAMFPKTVLNHKAGGNQVHLKRDHITDSSLSPRVDIQLVFIQEALLLSRINSIMIIRFVFLQSL